MIQIALRQLAKANQRYQIRQQDIQEQRDRQAVNNAYYLGFDASTGLASAELPDGTIVYGQLIANSGVAVGDKVAYTKPISTPYGFIKQMPRQ